MRKPEHFHYVSLGSILGGSNFHDAICGFLANKRLHMFTSDIVMHPNTANNILAAGKLFQELCFLSLHEDANKIRDAAGNLILKMLEVGHTYHCPEIKENDR